MIYLFHEIFKCCTELHLLLILISISVKDEVFEKYLHHKYIIGLQLCEIPGDSLY